MSPAVSFLFVFTAAAQAGQVIVIADLQHGVALVPDGTPFPSIRINGRDGNPLTFVHAADDVFASARNTIATTTPQASTEKMIVTHDVSVTARGPRMLSDKQFHAASDDSDTTYYINFYDGSWISARRQIIDYGFTVAYAVSMQGYAWRTITTAAGSISTSRAPIIPDTTSRRLHDRQHRWHVLHADPRL